MGLGYPSMSLPEALPQLVPLPPTSTETVALLLRRPSVQVVARETSPPPHCLVRASTVLVSINIRTFMLEIPKLTSFARFLLERSSALWAQVNPRRRWTSTL